MSAYGVKDEKNSNAQLYELPASPGKILKDLQ
jgi:hypothetical protein